MASAIRSEPIENGPRPDLFDAQSADRAALNDDVKLFSEQLFPGGVQLKVEADAETNELFCLVTCRTAGSVDDILFQNDRWHDLLRKVAGQQAVHYRLSLEIA